MNTEHINRVMTELTERSPFAGLRWFAVGYGGIVRIEMTYGVAKEHFYFLDRHPTVRAIEARYYSTPNPGIYMTAKVYAPGQKTIAP